MILFYSPRATEIDETFCANGFKREVNEALWMDSPEEPLFARSGKAHFFAEACRLSPVLVCYFRRTGD